MARSIGLVLTFRVLLGSLAVRQTNKKTPKANKIIYISQRGSAACLEALEIFD
jgi:hypothetical protein